MPDDLLKITVCDPACGSGHFLIAAARRIAKRYAAMQHGDEEPTPEQVQQAMRKVVARCIYGVDINPLAAELAKVSLWLESLEPGRPLEFLDAHIKVGNALLGATPKLLEAGLPDEAFKPIEGDDAKIAASLRRQNEKERGGQSSACSTAPWCVSATPSSRRRSRTASAALPTRSLADIRTAGTALPRTGARHPDLRDRKRIADAWCAAFVWRKHAGGPEADHHRDPPRASDQGETLSARRATSSTASPSSTGSSTGTWSSPISSACEDDARPDHNPDTGWQGGFSCVVGNPPWERVKLQEKEFFADPGARRSRTPGTRRSERR